VGEPGVPPRKTAGHRPAVMPRKHRATALRTPVEDLSVAPHIGGEGLRLIALASPEVGEITSPTMGDSCLDPSVRESLQSLSP
jgi:hypothetical protein